MYYINNNEYFLFEDNNVKNNIWEMQFSMNWQLLDQYKKSVIFRFQLQEPYKMESSKGNKSLAITEPYIEYMNTVLNIPSKKLNLIAELYNGVHLHEILSRISSFQIGPILGQPTTLVDCLNNLKVILRAIQRFFVEELLVSFQHEIELIAIAKNKSVEQLKKLVKLVIKTLFLSAEKDEYIEKVLATSLQTQEFFMKLMNEQTPKYEQPIADSKPNQLYDKLTELEGQNQQLLEVIQQLQVRNLSLSQKQKDLEDKLDERDLQVKRLKWEISELSSQTFAQNEVQMIAENQQENLFFDKIKQMQAKQKMMVDEMQKMRILTETQGISLKELKRVELQSQEQREENKRLAAANKDLSKQLDQTITKLQQTSQKLKQSLLTIEQISTQNSSFQSSLTSCQQQLLLKQQLIEQLQNNIKYLLETEKEQESISEKKAPISTIKEECRQIIQKQHFDKMSQAIIVRLKRQNQAFLQQLHSTVQINEKLQKQVQRLKLFQEENNKLVQMLSHMHKYRGQENEVLVHCLYKMRMKLLGKQMQSPLHNQPLTDVNRNY